MIERVRERRPIKEPMGGTNLGWCVKYRIAFDSIKIVKNPDTPDAMYKYNGFSVYIYGYEIFCCEWADDEETTLRTFLSLPYKTYNRKNIPIHTLKENRCKFEELGGYMSIALDMGYDNYLQNVIDNRIGLL